MINEFIDELRNGSLVVVNPATVGSRCEIASAMTPMCLDELKESVIEYKELEPIDGTYIVDNGYKLGRYTDPSICTRPYMLDKDGEYIVSVDHDKHSIFYFDKNFNIHSKYYTGENSDNRYPRSVAITDTKLYIGTDYNRLLCIDKATREVDWEFGVYGSRGKCVDGKIGECMQVQVLSNGNILVGTYDGAGDAGLYYGTLEEFDADGNWIKTHLEYEGTGLGVDMQTKYIQSIRVYDDVVYVGKLDEIDIFKYENGELTYIQTIRKPSNSGVDELNLRDFVIDGDILYLTAPNLKKVIGFNLIDQSVDFSVGKYSYESVGGIPHAGNGFNYPMGIVVVDGHIYVADSSNYNIVEVFKDDYIYPKFEVPVNIELLYSSNKIEDDSTVATPVGEEPANLHIVYKEQV